MTFSQIPGPLGQACRSNYMEARALFLKTAQSIACDIDHYQNEAVSGINGEALFCDVARLGPDSASRKILLSSGVHGVEAYCGSAMQILIMQNLIPRIDFEDLQIIFVHILNPYGCSHYTRNNENNIDLNRNFVDFSGVATAAPELSQFREETYPSDWSGSDLKQVLKHIGHYISAHGPEKFQTLMTQGQYVWPQDPYFGGLAESWSNQVWADICRKHCAPEVNLVHLDFHTGLGPRGACELIYTGSPTHFQRAKNTFVSGRLIAPGAEGSSTPSISGPLCCGLLSVNPDALCVALEFGTIPIEDMLGTLIEANWLHNNPNCCAEERLRIQHNTLKAFFIPEANWLDQVWDMSETYFMDALHSLNKNR
ncbi:DUF2817 domain-containing protein [Pseudoteredinibacter isoporae]|uniref:DUF2817 domain-containing protein n=1 Tax=Pseudoteredinibacter isoporae TaxID=570281 RepID=A0A7X0JUP7_9GAMM|nr:DUF2817 domain-containing protein [Pseudoteredinibacter isoporae]MBB6522598.1 hypothetical protein [Pseudoteredinibacter isoporae]NHO88128.1 DUF2817 domain-containing protein [Pseudoteredinibacter isoporae]NIB23541.1 DUF2817 domain-containing protein [Pseudoteredinibacter isoporae]